MKTIVLLALFFSTGVITAKSNVSAVYIKNGEILSVSIVDDPSTPPFEAGKIWSALKGEERLKQFSTDDISFKCDAVTSYPQNHIFGNCRFRIDTSILTSINNEAFGFTKVGDEANNIISNFSETSSEELLLDIADSKIQIGIDFKRILMNFSINKQLITD